MTVNLATYPLRQTQPIELLTAIIALRQTNPDSVIPADEDFTKRTMAKTADHPPTAASDAEIMQRVHEGEADASRELVELYLDRIVAYGYKMLSDATEAEDVAQDAFLRLWQNAGRWRPEAPVIHWLHRVTYNLCIDRLRRRSPIALELVPEPADSAPNPVAALQSSQITAAVSSAIEALPDRQRAAVSLVHQQGLSNIETAAIMDISVEAVESLLARGRRTLRRTLEDLRSDLEGEL